MSVKRETAAARRRLEFILRATVRLLARPGVTDKDLRKAVEHLLAGVGPGEHGTDVLGELMRRGEYVPSDGYPRQSMADSDIHGGFAQTGDTSTERAAMAWASPSDEDARARREPVRPDNPDAVLERDPAADALRELVLNIDGAATWIGDADQTRKYLLSIQSRQHDPEKTPDKCLLCDAVVTNVGEDRIKAGYCPACHSAWRRAGSPRDPVERGRFERERLDKLRTERGTVLHVNPTAPPVCPYAHVCCSDDMRRSAEHKHWRSSADCDGCADVRAAKAS